MKKKNKIHPRGELLEIGRQVWQQNLERECKQYLKPHGLTMADFYRAQLLALRYWVSDPDDFNKTYAPKLLEIRDDMEKNSTRWQTKYMQPLPLLESKNEPTGYKFLHTLKKYNK